MRRADPVGVSTLGPGKGGGRFPGGVLACALLLLLLLPLPLSAAERWAVVVGVGDYAHFGDEIGGDLHGPVNDARAVSDALIRRWGFRPDHVRLLLDEAATREGIRSALQEWIPSVARPGDVVIFYFAGHGSQSWDDDGDESDGLDETIAPHDVLRQSTENDITDDHLRSWLAPLRQQQVVVILDSCHSGTGTRAATPFARPRLLARRLEDLPRPTDSTARGMGVADASGPDLQANHVLEIAASQPDQVAMDVAWPLTSGDQVEWGGAFTRFLVEELWSIIPGSSYNWLYAETTRRLKLAGFIQDPLISAAAALSGQPIFDAPPLTADSGGGAPPTLPILRSDGDAITLSVPAGAPPLPGSRVLTTSGEFEIRELFADSARATRVSAAYAAAPPPVDAASARVLPRPPPPPALRLSLAKLPAALRSYLGAEVRRVEGIALLTGETGIPDILLDGDESRLLLIGRDGAVRAEVAGAAPEDLRAALEREVSFRRLSALTNPAQRHGVDIGFGADGALLHLGQTVELRVTSGLAGFLTVVDLAPDGTTTLLFPNEVDPGVVLGAGATLTLPTAAMIDAGIVFQVQEPTGPGMVRIIVTPEALPLEPDAEGRIPADAVYAALTRLLERAEEEQVWATAALVYSVRP